jgi:glycine cleavage system pyridoxal-binding protein P
MNLRVVDENHVGISINETTNLVDLDEIIEVFAELK